VIISLNNLLLLLLLLLLVLVLLLLLLLRARQLMPRKHPSLRLIVQP
jgi:hypothetical protein